METHHAGRSGRPRPADNIIKDSPSPAAAEGLTPEEEAELRRYYGIER
ncbi:hypothetical protein ACWF5H_07055 [Arthrobacter sp. NPDC055138]